jgi:hypothetical protein
VIGQILADTISGLIVNGVTRLANQFSGDSSAASRRTDELRHSCVRDSAVKQIVQQTLDQLRPPSLTLDRNQTEKLKTFLEGAEGAMMCRQTYMAILSEGPASLHLSQVEEEISRLLMVRTDLAGDITGKVASIVCTGLAKGAERCIAIAHDSNQLSETEVREAVRAKLIIDGLAAIEKNLALLSHTDRADVGAISRFEGKYRGQVASRHSKISPPTLDSVKKLDIGEIYVDPDFERFPKDPRSPNSRLLLSDFRAEAHRSVILGNPGAGKSTFAAKLTHDLASRVPGASIGGLTPLPVLIVLREYGARKKESHVSILDFIEASANSMYQVRPPKGAFEYFLLNDRAVVIFDGLDELLDTTQRQEVSEDIESFCHLYPSVPVIVTSRVVGYDQAPLDPKRFRTYYIAPFREPQVSEYARKWFAAELELDDAERAQMVKTFLAESERASDIRSNPLMLSLICNIYRGEGYIPQNRPDVYQKCATMLFDRWDRRRGIGRPSLLGSQLDPTLMFLAHWIYADQELQQGVSEAALVSKAAEYLQGRMYEDLPSAEAAAREFVEFCRGRAWVFTDTGTRRRGEPLFQFTHRTFLEYFTAAYLVRTHFEPESLLKVLLPRILTREWDVVAQLAFQVMNRSIEGAGDILLSRLMESGRQQGGVGELNVLSFVSRCLEFIVPSRAICKEVVERCVDRFVDWTASLPGNRRELHSALPGEETYLELIGGLLNCSKENRQTVSSTVEKKITELTGSDVDATRLAALHLGLHLVEHSMWATSFSQSNELVAEWQRVTHRIADSCEAEVRRLSEVNFPVCYASYRLRKTSLEEMLKWHGLERIFLPEEPLAGSVIRILYPPPSMLAIFELIGRSTDRDATRRDFIHPSENLQALGKLLLAKSPPWVVSPSTEKRRLPRFLRFPVKERRSSQVPTREVREILGQEGLFGLWAAIAVQIELESPPERELVQYLRGSLMEDLGLANLFLARVGRKEGPDLDHLVTRVGFPSSTVPTILSWVKGSVFLVGAPAPEQSSAS